MLTIAQSKNTIVVAYRCWKILRGLSDGITLSFMRVVYTRCTIDANFGRLKQSFRKSEVDTMSDVVTDIDETCEAKVPLRYCMVLAKMVHISCRILKAH